MLQFFLSTSHYHHYINTAMVPPLYRHRLALVLQSGRPCWQVIAVLDATAPSAEESAERNAGIPLTGVRQWPDSAFATPISIRC